jgi:hypothetical protein
MIRAAIWIKSVAINVNPRTSQGHTCLEDESISELDIPSITDRLNAILRPDESAKRQSSLLTDEIERPESHGDDGWLESAVVLDAWR